MVDTSDDLLLAAGKALQVWGGLEILISKMFATISDIPGQQKGSAVCDSVISFETRMDMLDVLMKFETIEPLELETWLRFSAKLRKKYKKRHELAHFSIFTMHRGSPQDETSTVYTLSPFLTYGSLINGEIRHLSAEQIRERAASFRELTQALTWFECEASARRGFPGGNRWPVSPLIVRLRELAAQILEERKNKQIQVRQ